MLGVEHGFPQAGVGVEEPSKSLLQVAVPTAQPAVDGFLTVF